MSSVAGVACSICVGARVVRTGPSASKKLHAVRRVATAEMAMTRRIMDVLWDGIEGIMVRWLGRIDTTGVLHDWILLSGVKLNAYPHRAICGRDVAVTALVGHSARGRRARPPRPG